MPAADISKSQLTLIVRNCSRLMLLSDDIALKMMAYGLHSASEVFQGTISNILCGIENAENSQEDIIVWEKTCTLTMKP